jgi:23S rRNA (cytosine1962-C5)-methyltransferase
MKQVFLKKNEEHRIRTGHLWVFSNEISKADNNIDSGDIVQVFDYKNQHLGSGFYNKNSLISVRLFSPIFKNDLKEYFISSLSNAFNFRKAVYPARDSFRMVYSESDFLPGLIIDKYNDTFVLQVYCFGIQKNIELILDILKEQFNAKNIFTKHDFYFRKLEGLPEKDELYSGEIGSEIISDGSIKYQIDFQNVQKTGFYFDQCDNREFIQRFCGNSDVLDCFCNNGGFGLHALLSGAKSVSFVDSSNSNIQSVHSNYSLNKFTSDIYPAVSDVFDYLEKCIASDKKFDIIILDPPAFAKSKKSILVALKAYTKLNKLALQILKLGGILATSSCSHHITKDAFIISINLASMKSSSPVQLIYFNSASLDHPQLASMPETAYLKFAVFRKY